MRLPSTVLNEVNEIDRLNKAIEYLEDYCARHEKDFSKREDRWNKTPKTVLTLQMLKAIRDGEYVK